jgi:hypothetical protein
MGLDIYLGKQITFKSHPVAKIDLPQDLISFLNAKNIFIDEYGTCHLQTDQIKIIEKLVKNYTENNILEKKYSEDIDMLIALGKNNPILTLIGD